MASTAMPWRWDTAPIEMLLAPPRRIETAITANPSRIAAAASKRLLLAPNQLFCSEIVIGRCCLTVQFPMTLEISRVAARFRENRVG